MKGPSENSDLKKKFEDFTYPVGDSNWDAISSRLPGGSPTGFLADKFASYSPQPSSTVWSNVSSTIQARRKSRPVAWWWYAAAASLLFLVYVLYSGLNDSNIPSPLVQEKTTKAPPAEKSELSENEITRFEQDSSHSMPRISGAALRVRSSLSDSISQTENIEATETAMEAFRSANNSGQLATRGFATVARIQQMPMSGSDAKDSFGQDFENTFEKGRASAMRMFKAMSLNPAVQSHLAPPALAEIRPDVASANVIPDAKHLKSSGFYDGTEASASQNLSLWAGSLMPFASSVSESDMDAASNSFEGIGSGLATSTNSLSINDYSPPVYYGINGEFKFWRRMSAGLGVGFLQMRSTSTQYFSTGERLVNDINDSYISIPIYLKFNFVDRAKFATYTTVGHGFDIFIGQKISTENNQTLQAMVGNNAQIEQSGNQANLFAGLGMHYKFARYFGVFAEASLMHYYQLSNNNFYSQQNYWPGLRFGLLVSFEQ